MSEFVHNVEFLKVDENHGLILGFAIVCKVDGEPYYDLGEPLPDGGRIQDHIPEDAMVKAAVDFMENSRIAGRMHERDENGKPVQRGRVVFAFPLTSDVAEHLDITTKRTGLLVAIKPDSPEELAKARRGEYRGFSIGGRRITDEDAE